MHTRRVVLSFVLAFSALQMFAQQAVSSAGATDANALEKVSPRLISFSDTLDGQPDGALTVTFSIYDSQQATTALWTETQLVQVTNGKYTALLGSTTTEGLPEAIFAADQAHWLAVQVSGTEKRHLLVGVPYAMKALEAERLGGLLPSQYVTLSELQTILQNSTAPAVAPSSGGSTTSPTQTAAASGTTPQPATDFTDNNDSEVLLVTQQGTGYAIHAISSGGPRETIFAENDVAFGTALRAFAVSPSGQSIGLMAEVASPDGISGLFNNRAGGKILSLRSNGSEVASVDQYGNLTTLGTFSGNGSGLNNIPPSAVGPQSGNAPNTIVIRDGSGSFAAGQITAQNFIGNGFGLTNISPMAVGAQPGNFPATIVMRDINGDFAAGQITALNFIGNGFGLTNISPQAIGAQPGNIPNSVVLRDINGNFAANQITALDFIGNGFGLTNISPQAVGAQPGNIPNSIVLRDINGDFAVNQITAQNFIGNGFGLTNISPLAVGAQPGNIPNSIVLRDINGNFAAGQISAQNFIGNGFGLTNISPQAVGAQPGNIPNSIVLRDIDGNFAANRIDASGLTVSGTADFTAATSTSPVRAVLSVNTPTTCQASKELLIKSDAPAGQQLFICNSTGDGYVLVGDGTGSAVAGVTVNAGTGLGGGGFVSPGGSVTLTNAGTLSFNGRTGNVFAAPGDYSFDQIGGTLNQWQLPGNIAYTNQANIFSGDQSITGNLNTTGNIAASGSVTANSVSATSAAVSGSANPGAPLVSLLENGPTGPNVAFSAISQNNTAGFFMSSGPSILVAGTPTHAVFGVSGTGINVIGTATADSFVGDGSGLTNVNASTVGGTSVTNLATNAALQAETTARQSADTTLQANISAEATARQSDVANLQSSIATESAARQSVEASLFSSISAETTARQSDIANLQTSINNVSAADAKLAASNTFTAGTQDFSGAAATLPVHAVLSANTPATCIAGKELLIKTDAAPGQQLFICDSTGASWNLVGDGASGGVTSFNGRAGSVSAAANDYSFAQISGSLGVSQLPALTGDVTAAAGTGATLLSSTGVTAGTYTKVHVDLKGRVAVGEQASFSDLLGSASQSQLPVFTVYNNQVNTFSASQAINGTVTANLFSGNGSSLTSVNAATLNGIPSNAFAQLNAVNTFTAEQVLSASTSANPALNMPSGPAPALPLAGDIWNNSGVLQYRDNASTTRSLVSTTQSGGLQLLKLIAQITPSTVGIQSCTEQNFNVPGVTTSDVLLSVLQPGSSSPGTNIAIGGWRISANNTVAIQFCNVSRNSSTPVSGPYTFALMR